MSSPTLTRFPGVVGTFMGRDALSLAVSHLGLTGNDTVLLPAYNCKEVLRPFKRTHVVLYDVCPDLTVDPEEINRKLRSARVKVLVLINYFGFLQPCREQIKRICAGNGVLVIEDCAHSLLTAGSGNTGDLSVYSFRKILPVPDGGGLRINLNGEAANPDFYPRAYSNVLSLLAMAKSFSGLRSDTLSRAGVANGRESLQANGASTPNHRRTLPISWFAARGIASLPFEENVEKRRNDYKAWEDFCANQPSLKPVFAGLPDGVCPLGFPVRIKDRDALVSGAGNRGIHLMVHWRLAADLEAEQPNSYRLSTEIVTLPVGAELRPGQREILAGLLARA